MQQCHQELDQLNLLSITHSFSTWTSGTLITISMSSEVWRQWVSLYLVDSLLSNTSREAWLLDLITFMSTSIKASWDSSSVPPLVVDVDTLSSVIDKPCTTPGLLRDLEEDIQKLWPLLQATCGNTRVLLHHKNFIDGDEICMMNKHMFVDQYLLFNKLFKS